MGQPFTKSNYSMSEPAPKTGDVVQLDCHVSTGGCSGINFRRNPFTGAGGGGMRQVYVVYLIISYLDIYGLLKYSGK